MEIKTYDEAMQMLQWIADRAAYRRACGIQSGADYAADMAMERKACAFLSSLEG